MFTRVRRIMCLYNYKTVVTSFCGIWNIYSGKSHTNIWHTQLDNTILDNNTTTPIITALPYGRNKKPDQRIQSIFNANLQWNVIHRPWFFCVLIVERVGFSFVNFISRVNEKLLFLVFWKYLRVFTYFSIFFFRKSNRKIRRVPNMCLKTSNNHLKF